MNQIQYIIHSDVPLPTPLYPPHHPNCSHIACSSSNFQRKKYIHFIQLDAFTILYYCHPPHYLHYSSNCSRGKNKKNKKPLASSILTFLPSFHLHSLFLIAILYPCCHSHQYVTNHIIHHQLSIPLVIIYVIILLSSKLNPNAPKLIYIFIKMCGFKISLHAQISHKEIRLVTTMKKMGVLQLALQPLANHYIYMS